jgi:hypothetical protein
MFMRINGQGPGKSARTSFLLPIAVMACFAMPALAQTSIDTFATWDGSAYISSFGVPNTATYGQYITVASGSTALQSFSFKIGNCGAAVTMRGEVYAWDGSKATGPALYESAATTIPASSAYQTVTFTPGGLTLPAGQYVLFASTSRDQASAPNSACRWGAVSDSAIANGYFVFQNNTADVSMWTGSAWSVIHQDLAMQVTGLVPPTTNVPATSTTSLSIGFVLLISVGLFEMMRRRQHVLRQ